jgi:hypothetical protein
VRRLLDKRQPDVNEDTKMFEMLGPIPQKPFVKVAQPETIEASDLQFQTFAKKNQDGQDQVIRLKEILKLLEKCSPKMNNKKAFL